MRLSITCLLASCLMALVSVVGATKPSDINARFVARPPQKVLKDALKFVSGDANKSAFVYGQKALFGTTSDLERKAWLIAIQAKDKGYCTFLSVFENSSDATEVATYVGCSIYGIDFKDFNHDGRLDARYRIRAKSNVADAWVDEEVILLGKDGGFCKSVVGEKFTTSAESMRCE